MEYRGYQLDIEIQEEACVMCEECVEACPLQAITSDPIRFHPDKCAACGMCVDVCPTGAISYG